jgi:hypothetical protein
MATVFLDLTGLTHYDSKLKTIVGGSLQLDGRTVKLLSVSGAVVGSATIPDTTVNPATATADGLMTSTQFTKLEGIQAGATKVEDSATNGNVKINGVESTVYTHPTGKKVTSGLYKITTDANGHITAATAVEKADITALGIPSENTTYTAATASKDGLMSSGDFSKLAGIDAGAEVNVIDKVSVNGKALTVSSKGVNIDLSAYALKSDISAAVKYKGQVDSYSKLPTSGQETGDMYNVVAADSSVPIQAGDNVVWNGEDWDVLSGTVEFSSIANADIDALFA